MVSRIDCLIFVYLLVYQACVFEVGGCIGRVVENVWKKKVRLKPVLGVLKFFFPKKDSTFSAL